MTISHRQGHHISLILLCLSFQSLSFFGFLQPCSLGCHKSAGAANWTFFICPMAATTIFPFMALTKASLIRTQAWVSTLQWSLIIAKVSRWSPICRGLCHPCSIGAWWVLPPPGSARTHKSAH